MRRSESRLSRDDDRIPRNKLAELERKRREWKIEQEKLREHEKRKQKMIQEYEERRAKELKLKSRSRRSRSHSSSRHRSRSKSRDKDKKSTRSSSSKVPVMSEKCDSSSSNTPLFKGSEGAKLDSNELKKIQVKIQRNIPNGQEPTELHRDILKPEDVVLERREGEGSNKPLLSREKLETGGIATSKVEEIRTVVAVDIIEGCHSSTHCDHGERRTGEIGTPRVEEIRTIVAVDIIKGGRSSSSARNSMSMSPKRYSLSQSPRRSIGGEGSKPIFDREELKPSEIHAVDTGERRTVVAINSSKKDERSRSAERNVTSSSTRGHNHSPRRSLRNRSKERSRERREHYVEHNSRSSRRLSPYPRDRRGYHSSSANGRTSHSLERHADDYRSEYRYARSETRYRREDEPFIRERRRPPLTHYVEPIPVPVYYGNFQRPIMLDPMMIRAPIPMIRGRIPMPGGIRPPFGPPYIPAEMYRSSVPNPRFSRMF